MSQYQQPPQPQQPYQQHAHQPSTRPKRWPWILGIIGTFLAGLLIGAAGSSNTTAADPASAPAVASDTKSESTDQADVAAKEAEPEYAQPRPKDFQLEVQVLDKECFGSAGCNVTYRIDVAYSGKPLDPDRTYEVVYEVNGVEDGPQIGTLTVTDDESSVPAEEYAMTPSSDTKLTAKVTDIL